MTRRYQDDADWKGISFLSVDVGARGKRKQYIHDGYHYATRGEWHLAQLLESHDVAFTPDVHVPLELPDGRTRTFVPDFLFNGKPMLWHGRGQDLLIHGIEVKGKGGRKDFSSRALENIALLRKQRGIEVLLLTDKQIKAYFKRSLGDDARRFPLRRLDLFDAEEE